MNTDEPFISLWFQGYKFEFIQGDIFIFDDRTKKKYKIKLIHYHTPPFLISLEEQN